MKYALDVSPARQGELQQQLRNLARDSAWFMSTLRAVRDLDLACLRCGFDTIPLERAASIIVNGLPSNGLPSDGRW